MLRCLLVAVLLAGCAGTTKVDPIIVSANTISAVGEQALATNTQYIALCSAKAIEQSRCAAWAEFFSQFQVDYVVAAQAYLDAVAAGKPETAQQYAQKIQALSNQLVIYILAGRQ